MMLTLEQFAQLGALQTMAFYRRLYLGAVAAGLAAGLTPEHLATDVCALAREAGVLVGKRGD